MAKRKTRGSSSDVSSQATFDKGFVTDVNDFHLPENAWTYARNAMNNSSRGDVGKLSSEQANVLCGKAPFTIIGIIYIQSDQWAVFSTNNVNSEIGLYTEGNCTYTKLVRSKLLNFNTLSLIQGVSRTSFDCSYRLYWDDSKRNPTRTLDISAVPYVQNCVTTNGCTVCSDTTVLDIDAMRLESLMNMSKPVLKRGSSASFLLNGSYHVHVAYCINGMVVSDYSSMSNVVPVFSHDGNGSSLELIVDGLDLDYDDYQVVVVSTVAGKTSAVILGYYSTHQSHISIDILEPTLEAVNLELLPLMTPVPDTSNGVYQNGEYLLRVGPVNKFDFNYQPLANQIGSLWTVIEYDKEYYKNGGVNVGYMRDEVYPFFIRWIFNTGDKSNAYHIPGRAATDYRMPTDSASSGSMVSERASCPATVNKIETGAVKVFEVYNTAYLTNQPNLALPDGGVIVGEGRMGYWESTELYDDKHPSVWNASSHPWSDSGLTEHDLCGQPIRHHKFPENTITNGATVNNITNHYADGGEKIRVLGVRFDNIKPPVDNNGVPLANIVGYEILRGSRNGNKTVLAKGMVNNMFTYPLYHSKNSPSKIGLYANYPFNDLRPDPFISKAVDGAGQPIQSSISFGNVIDVVPNNVYSKKHFTFHSPETGFSKPFLSKNEMKVYGELYGNTNHQYIENRLHPKHKFTNNWAFLVSIIAGMSYALAKSVGKTNRKYASPSITGFESPLYTEGYVGYTVGSGTAYPNPAGIAAAGIFSAANGVYQGANPVGLFEMIDGLAGATNSGSQGLAFKTINSSAHTASVVPGSGVSTGQVEITYEDSPSGPDFMRSVASLPLFYANTSKGIDSTLEIMRAFTPHRQFTLEAVSSCEYDNFIAPALNNKRKQLIDVRYVNGQLHSLRNNYQLNHLFRNDSVVLETTNDVTNPTIVDTSRAIPVSKITNEKDIFNLHTYRASSHYVALKNTMKNQYGSLQSITTIPTQSTWFSKNLNVTDVVFGGDTYIGKYSEKNTLYYFNQWLSKEPHDAILNYKQHMMFNSTTYWMDTDNFDFNEFIQSLKPALDVGAKTLSFSEFFKSVVTPNSKYVFDSLSSGDGMFMVNNAYMYLFNSGVRNFFVESELNIDFRDYGDIESQKHYPIISDAATLFHPSIIRADNYYKIDKSLSVNNLPFSKVSWASQQDRKYDPLLADTCYMSRPKRLIYSLSQKQLAKKDNWSVFLPNNYIDFTSEVTTIKPINKTGAMILFKTEAPGILPGVDEIRTSGNAKITIGDGTLFGREVQRISNSDAPLEFGSCQNRLSVVNTPAGMWWVCLDQGKIFNYGGGLNEISLQNNAQWLNLYLPYQLLLDFPGFTHTDNPVAGIGCQTIYDNEYGIVYFCKKDYRLKPTNGLYTITYLKDNIFVVNGSLQVKLGDPQFFTDASWTLSYDPKIKQFVSFHDWHPDLAMSGKNNFITTKQDGIWKHNLTCQKYCNYYGKDYPFEIEFQLDNKFTVATMRNVEYYLENFKYSDNCYDRFHVLNNGFDEAVVYNSEQVSGLLHLHLTPADNISVQNQYPKVTLNGIDILYSKEEQQYRFNQFWDVTKDRGEYTGVQNKIWITAPDGYNRELNPENLNYKKNEFERKKIRHNNNRVILRKRVVGDIEMLLNLAVSNMHVSYR